MRADGKTWAKVAEAFAQRYQVGGLTAMRLAHGMTQPQVVAEWCRRWPKEPRDDKALSCWERWPHSGHAPSLGTLDRLAVIYQCSVADLLAGYGDHRDLDTNARRDEGATRVFLKSRSSYDDLLSDLTQMATWSNPAVEVAPEATVADVVAIQAMSAAFQTADRKLGGGALYEPAARYLRDEVAPRLLASIGGPAEPHLFAAAASLTEAAGWMAHDTGDDQRARAHLSRAFRLASAAANPALIGNVCASMSHLARQLDQPDHAVRLAEVGLEHASSAKGVARLIARLHAMRARALSHQGAIGSCLAALEAAERALEVNDPAVVEWVSPFDAGSLASDTAVCLRAIGDLTAAERHARRAIELRPGDRVRSRALAQLTLAEVLVDIDRIDEAATTGHQVCQAAESLNSTQVLHRLDGLGGMLEPHAALPVVASFLSALTAVRERAAVGREAGDRWPT
jgi:tetratricopeptide (TPR) repeat protein